MDSIVSRWIRVNDVIERCRREVVSIVDEICRELKELLKDDIRKLEEDYKITCVIDVKIDDGNLGKIVPCMYVKGASRETFEAVKRKLLESKHEVVSEARLSFELLPYDVEVE